MKYREPPTRARSESTADDAVINICYQTCQMNPSHFLRQTRHFSHDCGLRGSSDDFLIEGALRGSAGLLMFALISICARVFVYAHSHVSSRHRIHSNHPKRFPFAGRQSPPLDFASALRLCASWFVWTSGLCRILALDGYQSHTAFQHL